MKRILQIILGQLLALALGLQSGLAAQDAEGVKAQKEEPKPWVAPKRFARLKNPVASSKGAIDLGRQIYATACISCHGPGGEGDGVAAPFLEVKPSSLIDPKVQKQADGELFWKISKGRSPMPGFEASYSKEQLWQAVTYIKSLAPKLAIPTPGHLLDEVVNSYAGVVKALAMGDKKALQAAIGSLNKSVAILNKVPPSHLKKEDWRDWAKSTQVLIATSEKLDKAKGLVEQRAVFQQFSNSLISSLNKIGYGGKESLREMACSKAFGGKGAKWVQVGKGVLNPYLGDKGGKCEKEVRKIGE